MFFEFNNFIFFVWFFSKEIPWNVSVDLFLSRQSHSIPITNTIKIKWRANVVDIAIFIATSKSRFDNVVVSIYCQFKIGKVFGRRQSRLSVVQKQKLHSDLSISTIKSNGYRWLTCGYNNTIKWLVLNSWFVAIGKRWVPGSKNVKWLRKVKIDIDGVSPSASVNECGCQEKFWLVVWHGIARSSNWMRRKLYNIEAWSETIWQ